MGSLMEMVEKLSIRQQFAAIICTREHFDLFIREHRIPNEMMRFYKHVGRAQDLYGLRPERIVLYGTYWLVGDFKAIQSEIRQLNEWYGTRIDIYPL